MGSNDARLRDTERRWRATGLAEDEGLHLLERVRSGALTRERLEAAAHCTDPGARCALGLQADPLDPRLSEVVSQLRRYEGHLPARAAILLGLRVATAPADRGLLRHAWNCADADDQARAEVRHMLSIHQLTPNVSSSLEVKSVVVLACRAATDGSVSDAMKAFQRATANHLADGWGALRDLGAWLLGKGDPATEGPP